MRTRLRRSRRLVAGPAILVAAVAVIFSVLFLSQPQAKGEDALVSTNQSDIAAGAVIYENHCQSCHGYQGEGGAVNGAPALVNVGAAAADFYLTTGRMPLNAPNNEARRHHPAFSDTEISQLVAYVNALPQITGKGGGGPTIPTVAPLCVDQTTPTTAAAGSCVTLSQGQALYAVNCAQCHQAAGSGGMLSKGNEIPSLYNANLTQVAEAPLVGPKPMPVFTQLTSTQLSAIAQYVEYLHTAKNPGGFGISHFGPVAEGFVSIVGGFALLWFATRMIGHRS